MTGVLEEEKKTQRDTAREEDHVEMAAGITVMPPQTKERQERPEAERGKKRFSPITFRGRVARPAPCFRTSGLQKHERINVRRFKLPRLW